MAMVGARMILFITVCLALLVSHVATQQYTPDQGDQLMSSDLPNVVAALRLERAGILTAQGALALRTLLTGAKPMFSGGRRTFHKDGDYVTALQDFFSVGPQGVSHVVGRRGESLLYGNIGDRVLTLKKEGIAGRPTLEVKDMTEIQHGDDPVFIDSIVYFQPLKSHKQ